MRGGGSSSPKTQSTPDLMTQLGLNPPPTPSPSPALPPTAPIPTKYLDADGEIFEFTDKQRRVIGALQLTNSQEQAAAMAGVTRNTVQRTFKLPAVQRYFRDLLAQNGVTDDLIARRIKEGLDATIKKETVGRDADGNPIVVQGSETPDYEQRGRYIDRALRMQGVDKPPVENSLAGTHAAVDLSRLTPEELKAFAEALVKNAPVVSASEAERATDAEIVEENGGDSPQK